MNTTLVVLLVEMVATKNLYCSRVEMPYREPPSFCFLGVQVRTTMQKIRRVFRARGMVYDPERMDSSKLEQEVAELRKISSEGLQRVLRIATSCLTGQDPNQIGDQVRGVLDIRGAWF